MKALITAAHGNQGKLLLPMLTRVNMRVRALAAKASTRDPLIALGADEVMIADIADPSVLKAAVAGVDAVYHICPNAHPREQQLGFDIVDAAKAAGVTHFVYSSVLHPEITTLKQHLYKREVEQHLIESGLPYTILRPAHYMQTLQYRYAKETGEFRLTWSLERRQALVDCMDVAAVAAKVLQERAAHLYATYELCNGECLTGAEIRDAMAEVAGRAMTMREVQPGEVIRTLFNDVDADKLFDARVKHFGVVADWYSAHDFMGNATVLTRLLGRKPITLRQFLGRVWQNENARR